ncbi:MAG TPA: DUF1416 domain-containing protein [Jiangellaceae bacterium]
MTSCGAPANLDGVDVSTQAVISGVVRRAGGTVAGAYVRLLDASGEFAAEVPTDDTGQFRFFAAPGTWTVRTLAAGAAPVDRAVVAQHGVVAEVEVAVQ